MRNQNTRKEILQNNRTILNNIKKSAENKNRNRLRAQGFVPFEDARKEGFKKVGFDVFQRNGDEKLGKIWAIEEIDGEKWLVCFTDKNDQLTSALANEIQAGLQKTATQKTAGPRIINPGDLTEIIPHTQDSINFKYRGKRGYVTAAMPDRSQLTFDDGSSLWVENKDLNVVRDARELGLGDTVRMFSRRGLEGKVIKFSHDKKAITFENSIGQQFTARADQVIKWVKNAQMPGGGFSIQNIWIDPSDPNAAKLLKEYMRGQAEQAKTVGVPMENTPEEVSPGVSQTPPSIKAHPTEQELNQGSAVPAKDLFNMPTSMPAAASQEMDLVGFLKRGRTLNVGDMVQKKSTGQTGFIVDINFDRKLGKFYLIDFGGAQPDIEYDTDIQKVNPAKPKQNPPFPQDYTRMRETGPGGLRHESKIDPKLTPIKEAATEFVSGMLNQALTDYETQFPGQKVSQTLEDKIIKQAIELYMAQYLPTEYRQVLSAIDKNALSDEIFQDFTEDVTSVNPPTTEDFVQKAPESDMWDLATNHEENLLGRANVILDLELSKLSSLKKIKPFELPTVRDKQAFVRQASIAMFAKGVPKEMSQIIADQLVKFKSPKMSTLVHAARQMGISADHLGELFIAAADALAFTTFTTADGKKYAQDLPGMETLRGGGGGYPGGMDVEPMGWEVRDPNKQNLDTGALQNALNENLEDQTQSLEAGPKINIELDPENKQIVIDYGEEEEPPMTLETPEVQKGEPSPNMPVPGPQSAQPGQAGGLEVPERGFNDENIPVNF